MATKKKRTNLAGKQIPIANIKIGKRHRRDMGDIDQLAKWISDVGLLHPVVVTPKYELVAGARRLAACKKLNWSKVPVTIVDLKQIVRGEFAENSQRKDFTPGEAYDIWLAVEPLEKAAAKAKQREHGGTAPGKHLRQKSSSEKRAPQTRDKVGAFAGYSGRTMEKITAVYEAAKDDPERFGHLAEEMNKTGKINPAFSQVNRVKKHQKIYDKARRSAAVSITDSFPLLYIDPPYKWRHFGEEGNENEKGKGLTPDQHYPTLTDEQIKNFRINGKSIPEIAAKDAALFMWCTSSNIKRATGIVEDWGFTVNTTAAWDKITATRGLVFRNQHEVLLYCTRGNMPGPQYQPASVFRYPRGKHSAKPPEIGKIIEKMYPDFDKKARLEIFARGEVKGWTTYGYEAGEPLKEAAE